MYITEVKGRSISYKTRKHQNITSSIQVIISPNNISTITQNIPNYPIPPLPNPPPPPTQNPQDEIPRHPHHPPPPPPPHPHLRPPSPSTSTRPSNLARAFAPPPPRRRTQHSKLLRPRERHHHILHHLHERHRLRERLRAGPTGQSPRRVRPHHGLGVLVLRRPPAWRGDILNADRHSGTLRGGCGLAVDAGLGRG
jgi:hypothetical protein